MAQSAISFKGIANAQYLGQDCKLQDQLEGGDCPQMKWMDTDARRAWNKTLFFLICNYFDVKNSILAMNY